MPMNPNPSIPLLSTEQSPKDIQSRFSKWISIDFLIDESEMASLFETLGSFELISPFSQHVENPHHLQKETFLKAFKEFSESLKKGVSPEYEDLKRFLFLMIMPSIEGIFLKPITDTKYALVFQNPYLEIKPITLTESLVDHTVRVAPLSKGQPWWGLRCSFPQIVQDSRTLKAAAISQNEHPLGQLFKKFRVWIREHTRSTPIVTDSKKVNHPIRLGKQCMSWIQKHPLLQASNIKVDV